MPHVDVCWVYSLDSIFLHLRAIYYIYIALCCELSQTKYSLHMYEVLVGVTFVSCVLDKMPSFILKMVGEIHFPI